MQDMTSNGKDGSDQDENTYEINTHDNNDESNITDTLKAHVPQRHLFSPVQLVFLTRVSSGL